MTVTFTESDLANFSGTEQYYKISPMFKDIVCTDGPAFVAKNGGGWILDVITSHQIYPKVRAEEFQVWDIILNDSGGCDVICTDGNKNEITRQAVEYTDLPFNLQFFLQLGSIDLLNPMWVLMLPGEY